MAAHACLSYHHVVTPVCYSRKMTASWMKQVLEIGSYIDTCANCSSFHCPLYSRHVHNRQCVSNPSSLLKLLLF